MLSVRSWPLPLLQHVDREPDCLVLLRLIPAQLFARNIMNNSSQSQYGIPVKERAITAHMVRAARPAEHHPDLKIPSSGKQKSKRTDLCRPPLYDVRSALVIMIL